jgi:enoyl-CoA hydratase
MASEYIRSEDPVRGVRRVVLARPERHNAQNTQLLYELNDALTSAAQDDDVKTIILAAEGKNFSSGHDLNWTWDLDRYATVSCWGGFSRPGAEGQFAREEELFLDMCWRWRNISKPTIAQVQGKVIGGGLMLIWPCDLIVCSSDALFSDPTVALAMNGIEYFSHPWELGSRRAKEMLFRGLPITAEEAHKLGMVNHVVARDELETLTLLLADEIARQPSMGLMLAKQCVNQAEEAQGRWTALRAAFSLHELGHSHNMHLHDYLVDPGGRERMYEINKGQPIA